MANGGDLYARLDRMADQASASRAGGAGGAAGAAAANPLEEFCRFWPVIKPVLEWVKLITPPKIDAVIDQFIRIADRLCAQGR